MDPAHTGLLLSDCVYEERSLAVDDVVSQTWKDGELVAFEEAGVLRDNMGNPVNPHVCETTGCKGRGAFPRCGANHMAHLIVTRKCADAFQVLAMRLVDDSTELPGDYLACEDGVAETRKECLARVISGIKTTTYPKQFATDILVHMLDTKPFAWSGHVQGGMDTDNAWRESAVLHLHVDDEIADLMMIPNAEDCGRGDATFPAWHIVDEVMLSLMTIPHGIWVRDVVEALAETQTVARPRDSQAGALLSWCEAFVIAVVAIVITLAMIHLF